MPNNRDVILLETVKTHRARLLAAFLYGEMSERRVANDNLRRVLGSVVLAAVVCTACIGFSLVTSLIRSQAAQQAKQNTPGTVVPGISDQPYAADYFDRSTGRGWGTAELGGRWTTTGPASDYRVRRGAGLLEVPAGQSRAGRLAGALRESADVTTTVQLDEVGSTVLVTGRRVGDEEYRAVVELTGSRQLTVALAAREGGRTVPLSNTVALLGRYDAGQHIRIRLQTFGVNPTQLRAKVWRPAVGGQAVGGEAQPEPTDWAVGGSDGYDALQRGGAAGVGGSRPADSRRALEISVQDFVARPVLG